MLNDTSNSESLKTNSATSTTKKSYRKQLC